MQFLAFKFGYKHAVARGEKIIGTSNEAVNMIMSPQHVNFSLATFGYTSAVSRAYRAAAGTLGEVSGPIRMELIKEVCESLQTLEALGWLARAPNGHPWITGGNFHSKLLPFEFDTIYIL